jgi:hypothetical protein
MTEPSIETQRGYTAAQKMRDLNRTRAIQHTVIAINVAGFAAFLYGAWRYLFRNR